MRHCDLCDKRLSNGGMRHKEMPHCLLCRACYFFAVRESNRSPDYGAYNLMPSDFAPRWAARYYVK